MILIRDAAHAVLIAAWLKRLKRCKALRRDAPARSFNQIGGPEADGEGTPSFRASLSRGLGEHICKG